MNFFLPQLVLFWVMLSNVMFLCPDTMIQVASSFSTDPSLDVVLSSIPARIYEAVHHLQENMDGFTAKVQSFTLTHNCMQSPKQICLQVFHPDSYADDYVWGPSLKPPPLINSL